jgi:hypothetical protein
MEHLFSPCTRLHDTLESQGQRGGIRGRRGIHLEHLQELKLDVSTAELLSAERGFTFADLFAMLGNSKTVVWLTPHAAVAREGGLAAMAWRQLDESCRFCFNADGKDIVAVARSPEHLLEICDIVVRLLAVSVVHSVCLSHNTSISAPTLAYLMEHCQSLKVLTLNRLEMDEDHIRALGAYSRPDLEIVLDGCRITSAGASTLVEVLRRNQGPTKLDQCYIENSVLVDVLRGNSRLKSLKPRLSSDLDVGQREVLAITGALQENKGLVDLDLEHDFRMSNETWDAVCDSLKTHPTLEVLDLSTTDMVALAPAVLKSRMQALSDMLKVNMSIHTMHLDACYSQHELYRGSVIPYLETNRLRPRLLAIQQTRPIAYRANVLGRALLAVRTDPNHFWMILSGNAEVAFPSSTTTTAAAANLTTAATAAATSTAVTVSRPTAAADATTATTATVPSTASASHAVVPTVAANVAAPSAGQKRKTRL